LFVALATFVFVIVIFVLLILTVKLAGKFVDIAVAVVAALIAVPFVGAYPKLI
jgi:hypothetical protein